MTIRYASAVSGTITLVINDEIFKKISYPSTGSWTTWTDLSLNLGAIPNNSTVRIHRWDGDNCINFDYVTFG